MNIFKKMYCRVYQGIFRLVLPILPYREPKILESLDDIAIVLKEKNIDTVMLVTDSGVRGLGLTLGLEESLPDAGIKCVVYDKTQANPTTANVEEAFNLYQKENCKSIIAFGGGSAMDCAKALGARVVYPKKPLQKLKGLLKIHKKLPTLFAVPTTAGTGSETTLAAVITDSQTHHKYTLMDFNLIPQYAVLDSNVTLTLPPKLTATTGMDALTHAVEAFIGRSTTKQTRKYALTATKLVFENIKKAYDNGHDKEARANMLKAAYLAGIAFSKSYVGYIHAIAHSLGGKYNIAHGFANAVIMPIVLEEYGKSAYKKLHKLGVVAGVSTEYDSHEIGAKKFINAIKELNASMGLPKTIEGIKQEDIQEMAKHAEKEANPLYPVPKLYNAKELEKLYMKVGGIE